MQGTIIRKINETRDYLSDRLPKENKEKFERIVIEYKNKGYVGTQQFTTLIEIYKSVGYWQGKESVADVSKGLP